jgi:hypothetical protein
MKVKGDYKKLVEGKKMEQWIRTEGVGIIKVYYMQI